MIIAELPLDEDLRLADLTSYDILDTPAEDNFDDLVELASQICNCPISLITLLDKDRQWFKAKKGLEGEETSKDVAFCAHAILQDDVFVVEDALLDERFVDNPFVTGEPNVRFYAGAPIVSPAGFKLGTICILDQKPKKLTKEEERALTLLSNQITKLLELRKKNKLIRQRAKEMIDIKSKTISRVLKKQEEDKKAIAHNLHENLAQLVASSLMYLKMGESNEANRESFTQTAINQLQDVLRGMRSLTNIIMPPTLKWVPTECLIKEFVEKIEDTFPFKIKIETRDSDCETPSDIALVSIRIIEQWLKVLSDKKEITQVVITIQSSTNEFKLQVEDNSSSKNFDELEKEIFNSLIYDRVQSQSGTVELHIPISGKNMLEVRLPTAV